MSSSDNDNRDAGRAPSEQPGRRSGRQRGGPGRRALLIGAGAAVLGGAAYGAAVGFDRLWWRLPGAQRPREDGELDYAAAEWIPASEANHRAADRPYDFTVDRVVVHVTQCTFPVAVKVFQDPAHGAAAHYLVRSRDGHVAQMIRELDVGYHAGNRAFNERSIGIEHEGWVDQPRWFTDAMYRSSAKLCADICDRHGIPKDRAHIVTHAEVPGTDHTDPGPHWDWDRYLELVNAA